MKKLLLLITVSFFTIQSFGQLTFGVSPGLNLNTAYLGYKVNPKIMPYVGFQYFNVNINSEHSQNRYDNSLNKVVNEVDIYELKANLYIPNVGVKYFLINQNKLQGYLSVNFSKPILTGKIELGDGNWENDFEDEFEKEIKNISFWGGELGFGVEYFFDDNFSLGGEFGFRHFNFKYDSVRDGEYYNPETGDYVTTDVKDKVRFNSNPTFSKITLNFYFQKKTK